MENSIFFGELVKKKIISKKSSKRRKIKLKKKENCFVSWTFENDKFLCSQNDDEQLKHC